MKNIEEIKNRIDFALVNKEIDGFIENDCLYIRCPKGYSPCVYLIFSFPFFAIAVLAFFAYIGVLWRYVYWIPICYFFFSAAITLMSKDFLVFDYNRGQFYISSKFDKSTIWKGFPLNIRDILELGINNNYFPVKKNNIFAKETESEDEYIKKNFWATLVYLTTDGKIKSIIPQFRYNNDLEMLKNISCYCAIIAELLEIPSKICTYKQKLELASNDKNGSKTLNIIPIDLAYEKKKDLIFRFKVFGIYFIVMVFLPLEIIFIMEHGFIGSFYAWIRFLELFFTEYIPRQFGLK